MTSDIGQHGYLKWGLLALPLIVVASLVFAWGHLVSGSAQALSWTIGVDPSTPMAGDAVQVTAYASGSGGIPTYTLQITSGEPFPVLALESPSSISVNQLGVPVTWDLTAVQAGDATLQVHVTYEKEVCGPFGCFFQFNSEQSPVVSVRVNAPLGGIGAFPEVAAAPLQGSGSSGLGAGVLAAIAAAAAAGAVALGGAAWYARRRLR